MLISLFKNLKASLKQGKLKVWGMFFEYQQPMLRDSIWILFLKEIIPPTASQVLLEEMSLVFDDLNE